MRHHDDFFRDSFFFRSVIVPFLFETDQISVSPGFTLIALHTDSGSSITRSPLPSPASRHSTVHLCCSVISATPHPS